MPSAFVLLRCIGKAVVKNVVNLFTFGLGGDILVDAWAYWQAASREERRTADVQALAAAPAAEVAAAAEEIVGQVGAGLSDAEKRAVMEYLQQVPPMIRRSQRRPADTEGKTVRPGATFRRPDDLLPLLPPQLPRFKPGDRPLPGVDWELVELLGRGGFGEVWKAKNPHFDGVAPVALKFCLDPAAKERLLRHEAAVLNQVMRQGRHDGIVPLLHTYLSADPPCLAYEYVAGGDLAGLIQDTAASGGMPPPQAARYVQSLAAIVGFANGLNPPIVHRDLKPANILVQLRPDGKAALKIADFGIGGVAVQQAREASRRPTAAAFFTSAVLGSYTLLYASPQQMRGEAPHPSDDVYALGVIWHQLLTGDVTKGCPTGRSWQKRLTDRGMSQAMVDLLIDCFGDEREERPANAAVLAERLRALLDVKIPPPPPPPQPLPKGPEKQIVNSIGMKQALIPAGSFLMGSPDSERGRQLNEGPQHEVTISRPFYLGIYPVTVGEFRAFVQASGYKTEAERDGTGAYGWIGKEFNLYREFNWRNPGWQPTEDDPVVCVSWNDSAAFCQWLSQKEGRAYGLPTEAEWEYACRAGTTTPFHFGATLTAEQANFGSSRGRTTKVGSYPPNAWGLFDMHGNVSEWCADWYENDAYRSSDNKDPQGSNKSGSRVCRGGSWNVAAVLCRAARRFREAPADRYSRLGFRVRLRLD